MAHIARLIPVAVGFIALDMAGNAIAHGASALEIIGRQYEAHGGDWRTAEQIVRRRVDGTARQQSLHKAGNWDSKIRETLTRNIQARNARKRA